MYMLNAMIFYPIYGEKTALTQQDLVSRSSVKPTIPPARGSPSAFNEPLSSRQETVNYISKKGIYAWQSKNNYGRRAKVENKASV